MPGGAVLLTKQTHTNKGRINKDKGRNKRRAALWGEYALAMDAKLRHLPEILIRKRVLLYEKHIHDVPNACVKSASF